MSPSKLAMWVAATKSYIGSASWTQCYVKMEREWIWKDSKEGGDYDQIQRRKYRRIKTACKQKNIKMAFFQPGSNSSPTYPPK